MAQALGKNFTLGGNMNATMRNLEVHVTGLGYDSREPKPTPPESIYIGGVPTNVQLLKPDKQFTRLSFDKLDYGRVPQYASHSHLVLIYNESTSNTIDFTIDDSTTSLFQDGLLSISAMYGRIEPQSHAVLNITIHANTQPVLLRDRLKISVRELIRGVQKKNNHKLLDKIRKKVMLIGGVIMCIYVCVGVLYIYICIIFYILYFIFYILIFLCICRLLQLNM